MPTTNSIDAFMPTLVKSVLDLSQKLTGTFAVLDSVYIVGGEDAQSPGPAKQIDIPVPTPMTATDIGSSGFTAQNAVATVKSIPYNKHPAIPYIIRSFEQFRSVENIRDGFLDQAVKGVAEFVNRDLAGLFTASNFPTYAVHNNSTTAGGQKLVAADIVKAWGDLATGKVNLKDFANLFLRSHPKVYGNMLVESTIVDEGKVGVRFADDARRQAILAQQFGAQTDQDIDMPFTNGAFTSTGDDVYTSAFYHRTAIALATRPLPEPDLNTTKYIPLNFKGLNMRVMISWSHVEDGWLVTVDAGYGRAVVRPEVCSLLTSG